MAVRNILISIFLVPYLLASESLALRNICIRVVECYFVICFRDQATTSLIGQRENVVSMGTCETLNSGRVTQQLFQLMDPDPCR
jgi:hypothetical protein